MPPPTFTPTLLLDGSLHGHEATYALGQALGARLGAGDVLALIGDLGAGKTTFTQGLAVGLGVPPHVTVNSPTFTLVRSYEGRVPLHHLDLYRLGDVSELHELGLDDLFTSGGVVALEWADRFAEVLPPDRLELHLAWVDADHRRFSLHGEPARWAPRLQGLGGTHGG